MNNNVEPSELDLAILDRLHQGLPPVGPLTEDETGMVAAYERYHEELAAEYAARDAAGGRTICPTCGERKMRWQTVCTLGYPGHPGAEFSEYGRCENCGHEEL